MHNIISRRFFGEQLRSGHWSTDSLVFYWRGIPAGNAVDESFSRNYGTITGATRVGRGLSFDGTDDEVSLSLPSGLVADGPVTIVVKARQTVAALEGLVNVQAATGSAGQIALLYLEGNESRARLSQTATGARGQISNTVDTGEWHQYIATHAGGGVQGSIYIDGVLQNSGGETSLSAFGTNVITIGAGFNATFDFTGEVAYCYIYNRVLSAGEAQQISINPDLPMQQYPAWMGSIAVAGVTIPIMIHHYKQAGGL